MPLFKKSPKSPIAFNSAAHELRVAAAQGDSDKISDLLRKGARLIPDKDGRTAVHLGALCGHTDVVQVLAEQCCDLNVQDKLGYSAIQRASIEGHFEVVRILLDAGASGDQQDFVQENTALHEAAAGGHLNVLKLLLSASVNMYIRNKTGATALHVACQNGKTLCVRWLLQKGCKADVKDKYDDSPLHTAVRYLHTGATKVLLSFSANVNEQNKNGDTPLHLSCNLVQKKISRLLLQAGAATLLRNKQRETATDIASRKQSTELMAILRTTQIRERLRNAAEEGSQWQLLFQDSPEDRPSKTRIKSKTPPPFSSLTNGGQCVIDIAAANIDKGWSGQTVRCYCAPLLTQLARHSTEAHKELLDEIDACHDELSHEISDLRQITQRHLTDLHQGLCKPKRSTAHKSGKKGVEEESTLNGKSGNRGMHRSRSESELETDIERERLVRAGGGESASRDSLSNASDDIYIERYWRSTVVRSSPSHDSHSRGSSKRSSGSSQRTARYQRPLMASIRETFQDTLQQFNRLDLDDSCTTPTSGTSSQPYTVGGTATSRSGVSQPHSTVATQQNTTASPQPHTHTSTDTDGEREQVDAEELSQRVSLYSCQCRHQCPQPPSLDSGYGTGFSPSPALCRATWDGAPWTHSENSSLNGLSMECAQPALPHHCFLPPTHISTNALTESATQTDTNGNTATDSHEYSELQVLLRHEYHHEKHNMLRAKKPVLVIPPPPNKPLPPLPIAQPYAHKRKTRNSTKCVSTNV